MNLPNQINRTKPAWAPALDPVLADMWRNINSVTVNIECSATLTESLGSVYLKESAEDDPGTLVELFRTITLEYALSGTADERVLIKHVGDYPDDSFSIRGADLNPNHSLGSTVVAVFADAGIVGTMVVATDTVDSAYPQSVFVDTVSDDVGTNGGWAMSYIRRLSNADVDADFPGEIGARSGRSWEASISTNLATIVAGIATGSVVDIVPPYAVSSWVLPAEGATFTKTIDIIPPVGGSGSGSSTITITTSVV